MPYCAVRTAVFVAQICNELCNVLVKNNLPLHTDTCAICGKLMVVSEISKY